MAVKFFCDGCDEEIESRGHVQVAHNKGQFISIDDIKKSFESYNLCDTCTKRLETDINPKSWPRIARRT